MDMSRSILSPLSNKAKSLSEAARQQLADIDTAAIRDHVAATTKQIASSARDAALAVGDAAAPYLNKMANVSQQQLRTLGDTLESNARAVAKRWGGKRNIVSRHPIAATLLVGSLGYLAYRAWQRSRAELAAAPKAAARKRAPRKTNGAGRSKQVAATRAASVRTH